ncbi:MAG: hypothetical protein GXP32_02490 [Kiritimatiellaeota bacterium]|nr:hypothetical protein [Kiritimatiellota bacterium]
MNDTRWKFRMSAGLLVALLGFAGCKTVNVNEALQVPEGTKLYTSYNIWKPGRWKISSINYQRGKLIPFGTEVAIVDATERLLTLKVAHTGMIFKIRYHEEYGLQPMSEYVKQLLTTKGRQELAKGIKPETLSSILDGKVVKGMNKREVELTCGPPSPHRTPSKDQTTWIYWRSRWNTFRVIFKNNKVIEIL